MTDATLPRVRPAAALTVSLAVALYALLWVGWMHEQPWVIRPDNWALEVTYDAAQDHRWWVPLWHGLSLVFAPMLLRVLVLIPVILELRRHRTRVAIFLAVSVWGSGLVTTAAKFLADRNRPETQMVQAMNTSFPLRTCAWCGRDGRRPSGRLRTCHPRRPASSRGFHGRGSGRGHWRRPSGPQRASPLRHHRRLGIGLRVAGAMPVADSPVPIA